MASSRRRAVVACIIAAVFSAVLIVGTSAQVGQQCYCFGDIISCPESICFLTGGTEFDFTDDIDAAGVVEGDGLRDTTLTSQATVGTDASGNLVAGTAGAAAGTDGQVQYNNGGVLGGASNLEYDDGTGYVLIKDGWTWGDGTDKTLTATIDHATGADAYWEWTSSLFTTYTGVRDGGWKYNSSFGEKYFIEWDWGASDIGVLYLGNEQGTGGSVVLRQNFEANDTGQFHGDVDIDTGAELGCISTSPADTMTTDCETGTVYYPNSVTDNGHFDYQSGDDCLDIDKMNLCISDTDKMLISGAREYVCAGLGASTTGSLTYYMTLGGAGMTSTEGIPLPCDGSMIRLAWSANEIGNSTDTIDYDCRIEGTSVLNDQTTPAGGGYVRNTGGAEASAGDHPFNQFDMVQMSATVVNGPTVSVQDPWICCEFVCDE